MGDGEALQHREFQDGGGEGPESVVVHGQVFQLLKRVDGGGDLHNLVIVQVQLLQPDTSICPIVQGEM